MTIQSTPKANQSFSGIINIIQQCTKLGIKQCIYTTTERERVEKFLQTYGLSNENIEIFIEPEKYRTRDSDETDRLGMWLEESSQILYIGDHETEIEIVNDLAIYLNQGSKIDFALAGWGARVEAWYQAEKSDVLVFETPKDIIRVSIIDQINSLLAQTHAIAASKPVINDSLNGPIPGTYTKLEDKMLSLLELYLPNEEEDELKSFASKLIHESRQRGVSEYVYRAQQTAELD